MSPTVLLAGLVGLIVLSSCDRDNVVSPAAANQDELVAVLEREGLTSAASAVEAIGSAALSADASFTFLAPTDEAFASLSADDLAESLTDNAVLTRLLRDHVLAEPMTLADIASEPSVIAGSDATLEVDVVDDVVRIGPATVVEADLHAGEVVVHVIDDVITDADDAAT